MPSLTQRALTGLSVAAALCGWSTSASAQYFGDPCNCSQPIAAVAAPIVACAPMVAVNPCPTYQPVTTMEERQVQTVQMVPTQKTVKVAEYKTVMEPRQFVQYQTVNEPRTANIQEMSYQTVQECRPVTVNRSYWQTSMQPVPKMASCQYDPRPGMLGAMNRFGWDMRMAFTPNYIPRRQFVPNVVAYNQPVQRVVAVPTTRQVTYNVAKLVPTTVTQEVPVQKLVYRDEVVTVMEPTTTTRTVQVPVTRMALMDPYGGGTASAAVPTPATSAAAGSETRTSEGGKGTPRLQSAPGDLMPLRYPTIQSQPTNAEPQPTPADADEGPVAKSVPSAIRVAGWQTSRNKVPATPAVDGPSLPELKFAQK